MSTRVRHARHLASVLTRDTGTDVQLVYVRTPGAITAPQGGYEVRWQGGPTEDDMRRAAEANQDEAPLIPVQALAYERRRARS
ncbi:hypothetical protein [Saccharothrix sp. HUAS TT1]|uniref:hypothetical protein n=1 Tax=unclassified Saccharothrix TaxID=2593673 RepID=UPI00345C5C8B